MKNIIIGVLIAACVAIWLIRPKEVEKTIEPTVQHLVDTEVKRVNKKIDEKGFEHAVIEEIENTVNRGDVSDSVKNELDSITNLLGIKDRQLKHYIRYSTVLKDSLLQAEEKVNDTGDTTYTYSDKWANITYVPDISGGHFNFKYDAEINYTEYWKRDGFFKPKKHYVDFWISDQRATINGVNRIKFNTNKKASTLRVNALAMYHDGMHGGVDGQIRIIGRYWLGGGYLYDFEGKEWKPVVTVRYNVIDW